MSERRNGPPLQQPHTLCALNPMGESLPRKLGTPPQPLGQRREQVLESAPRPLIGADAIDQDDLAARLQHAGKFIQSDLGARHRVDDVLSNDGVKGLVWKRQLLRVHDYEAFDVIELLLKHAL